MTELILIRHGETDFNIAHRWQGWSDTPLNETGRSQAASLARRLRRETTDVRAIYSSPLSRAYETARIVGAELGLPVRLVEGLRELHFGLLEGLTTAEFQSRHPDEYQVFLDRHHPSYTYPGGESRIGFFRRVSETLATLIERHPHDSIVVVCHGGTLRAALMYLFPGRPELGRLAPVNCGVTRVHVNGAEPELVLLDDAGHLQPDANRVSL